jgi:MEDS: MEthanogen/methylotroph, DcmR Sensory domain
VGEPCLGPLPHVGLSHAALLYDDDEAFVSHAVDHLRDGARAGEQLIVACTERRTRLLLSALDRSLEVRVLGNDYTYRHAISTTQLYAGLTRQAVRRGAAGVRVVGELPAAVFQHPRVWPQWSRYEAVVNHALAALPFHALCTYDRRVTPTLLQDIVQRTHLHLWGSGVARVNDKYTEPDECLEAWADPEFLSVESSPPMLEVREITGLRSASQARGRLEDLLAGIDTVLMPYADLLPPADPTLIEADAYVLGVEEVLMSALAQRNGPVTLRVWVVHDQVVTTVTSPGGGVDDPFSGYLLPDARAATSSQGRRPWSLGLWIARQMCDELSFRHADDGFTVRLRADLDVRAP